MEKQVWYVELKTTYTKAWKRAMKYRRPRTFWEHGYAVSDPLVGFYLGFFPITFPFFLLLKRPHKLLWLRLAWWPFYEVDMNINAEIGLQKIIVYAEAMKNGLNNTFCDPVLKKNYKFHGEPKNKPFVIAPKKKSIILDISDYEEMPGKMEVKLPFQLDEVELRNYLLKDAIEEGIIVEKSYLNHIRHVDITAIRKLLYPIWIAKYVYKNFLRYQTISAVQNRYFDRLDITTLITSNEAFSVLKEA